MQLLYTWWAGRSVLTRNILRGLLLALLVVLAIKLAIYAVVMLTHNLITLTILASASVISIASGSIMFLIIYYFDCKILHHRYDIDKCDCPPQKRRGTDRRHSDRRSQHRS